MFMPVMPFSSGESQMTTGHPEVSLRPVPGVGAHRSPFAFHQDLEHYHGHYSDNRYLNMDDIVKEVKFRLKT